MLVGNVSLTSQDSFNSVNLKQRAVNTVTLVRNAIRGGKIPLPDKIRSNIEWELMEIQRGLDSQVAGAAFELKSVLPAAWLEARWEAVFPAEEGKWYPYFRHVTTGPYGKASAHLDYAHSEEIKPLRERAKEARLWEVVSGPIDMWMASLVLSAEGRGDDSSAQTTDYRHFLLHYHPNPDPLVSFEFVRGARSSAHSKAFAKEISQMAVAPGPISSQQWIEVLRRNAPLLLTAEEKLKYRMSVAFQQSQQGTVIRLSEVKGVDARSAMAFLQIQRLCLILLWLVYGNKMASLDHASVSYVDAEEKMKSRGVSDMDSNASPQDEGRRGTLEDQIEKEMVRRKATPITGIESANLKAWADRKGMLGRISSEYVIISASCMSAKEVKDFELCLRQKDPKVTGAVLLIAREVDGTAVRHLSELLRCEPRIFGYAALGTGLLAASQWVTERCNQYLVPPVDPLRQLETFFKSIKQPCPQVKSADLLLDLAQRMSVVDPVLSICWLALRHCQWLKQTN